LDFLMLIRSPLAAGLDAFEQDLRTTLSHTIKP
jgi:hypothetical protein